MNAPIRSAIRFSVIVAVLTAVVLFVQRRWPEYEVLAQTAVSAAYVVYFVRFAVKQDRARQSA